MKQNEVRLILILLILILFIAGAFILKIVNRENNVYASYTPGTYQYEEEKEPGEINITRKEYEKQETEIEYITTYETDETLPKGIVQAKQEGRTGKKQIVIEKTYENDELINEEVISDKIIKAPINKIVVTGGSKYSSNYKIKVGDTLYVTPYILELKLEPDANSEKIYTLAMDDEVILLGKEGTWYNISYKKYTGYVPENCLTYLKPESEIDYNIEGETLTKEELLSKLSFNIKLNAPSGLSLEQFKKVLTGMEQDSNKIFEQNAEYFYYIEKQYNINGIFVAAIGIHESNFGKSQISLDKKNLFGYGANDSNPYNNAYDFSDYSEGIDLIARVLTKYYINPAGTKIYDGQVATGDYYYSSTLSGVNEKYATDKNWANSVYKWMTYLYNRI